MKNEQLKSIAGWVFTVAVLITLLSFVNRTSNDKVCRKIEISIDRSQGNQFVDEEDIHAMVYHEIDTIVGKKLNSIDAQQLEIKVNHHPCVASTEIYKSVDGKLRIEVAQRSPILRIFTRAGESYYLDSEGRAMPVSRKFTARVPVANGLIRDSYQQVSHLNLKLVPDSMKNQLIIDDLFRYADFIRRDAFWSAQIEQFYVNKDMEIELIPRVGNHRIVFGDATQIAHKFNKLKVFYTKGLPKTGWNEYSVINLKYANQIVCKKRI
jgi:cell division protein FtsQ